MSDHALPSERTAAPPPRRTLDHASRRAALRNAALFRPLGDPELDAILARTALRRAGRGEVLLHRGDTGQFMFIIVSGRVRVGLVSEDGKEVTLTVLGAGDVLGEMSLLDGEACSADAVAQEECVLLVVDRGQFLRLLRGNGDMCLSLMGVLCRRLRRSNAALEDMALLDLPTRLGRLLLRLAGEYGSPAPQGTRIEVKLSQKDLAALVGGSREKVNRQLRQWEQDGVLGKEAGHVIVRQPAALAAPVAADL